MASITTEVTATLIQRCARGEQDAWNEFILSYGRLIESTVRAARKHCGLSYGDAEDVVSTVYEKLLEDGCRRLMAWRGQAKLSTFLVQVTRNLCVDYVRKHGREPILSRCDENIDPLRAHLDSDDYAERERRLTALKAAIDRLSPKQRMIMQLRLEGKSLRDIATMMRLPSGTVFVENSRAIERLKTALGNRDGQQS